MDEEVKVEGETEVETEEVPVTPEGPEEAGDENEDEAAGADPSVLKVGGV